MFPRWHRVVDRRPISTSAFGLWRVLMHSRKFFLVQTVLAFVVSFFARPCASILGVDLPSSVVQHEGRFVPNKLDAFPRPIYRTLLGEAAQFPGQNKVAEIISEDLGVGDFFRIFQPVNSGMAGDAGGKAVVQSTQRLYAPHGYVEHMDPLIAQLAVSVVPEKSPRVMKAVDVEGTLGRRPQPNVIVHRGRRIGVRRIAD